MYTLAEYCSMDKRFMKMHRNPNFCLKNKDKVALKRFKINQVNKRNSIYLREAGYRQNQVKLDYLT